MKIVWNNKLCQVAKGNGVRLNNMRNGEKNKISEKADRDR